MIVKHDRCMGAGVRTERGVQAYAEKEGCRLTQRRGVQAYAEKEGCHLARAHVLSTEEETSLGYMRE